MSISLNPRTGNNQGFLTCQRNWSRCFPVQSSRILQARARAVTKYELQHTFRNLLGKRRGAFTVRSFRCQDSSCAWPSPSSPPGKICAASKPAWALSWSSSTTSALAARSAAADCRMPTREATGAMTGRHRQKGTLAARQPIPTCTNFISLPNNIRRCQTG
jgi:hypothetical protein